MPGNLSSIRRQLKAQWISANQNVFELRKKIVEAEQTESSLKRTLDAIEKAAPETLMGGMPTSRTRSINIRSYIVQALNERGPMTPQDIVKATNISYPAVMANLKKGPFQQLEREDGGGRTAKRWKIR